MSEDATTRTIIGADCTMRGELSLEGDATIMGRFEGDIRVAGTLEVGKSAEVSGTIVAGALRIAGKANADVIAEHCVELLKGARLSGRLFSMHISVCDGGEYEGEINVGPQAMKAAMEWANQLEEEQPQAPEETGEVRTVDPAVEVDNGVIGGILSQRRAKASADSSTRTQATDDAERAAG